MVACDMKKLVTGILAHVDAGKTTLSEALLYQCGAIRKLGRVDHGDSFLDTENLERERGITIFSKQAVLSLELEPGSPESVEITLLDTPGHVDFSAEAERTLRVLDCAVLVISGSDGVQGHSRTLWKLLERYSIPVFLFFNKMDLPGANQEKLLCECREKLHKNCIDFTVPPEVFMEEIAVCDDKILENYLETGEVSDQEIATCIQERKIFPCFFGSALKLEGIDAFLSNMVRYAPINNDYNPQDHPAKFGARIYKISRDAQDRRLTHMKITGGVLHVKDRLTNQKPDLLNLSESPEEQIWEEKVDQIRIYSGAKFRTVDQISAGSICAVTGLSRTFPGQGLGFEQDWTGPVLEPVLSYQVKLEDGVDPHTALPKFRQLEEEDPQLHVVWNEPLRELHVRLMGEIQLEILRRILQERFDLRVEFGTGGIVYRETIAAPVEGVGHFEPLRHYAEVHLLLEPGELNSGLQFSSICSEDQLDRNWQRLILTHLAEKEHLGVLTGSPITDMRIILTAGRAHKKHTEGGDFRQATYRAVRQGLMSAESVLLEPWYDFRLELPTEQVGRAISDVQRMNGETNLPESIGENGEEVVLTGSAPVAGFRDYTQTVSVYTRGRGRLFCQSAGYRPCADSDVVIAKINYDPERDVENTPDSVFCAHGGGYLVKWDQVPELAHIESGLRFDQDQIELEPGSEFASESRTRQSRLDYAETLEQDKELQAIFERTYGPVKRSAFLEQPKKPKRPKTSEVESEQERQAIRERFSGPEYLLVDGYNIIFAWDELKRIARENLDAARKALADLLCNYQGFRKCEIILVFDAYKVKGGQGSVEHYHNIHVVYTKEAETADAYIERVTYEMEKSGRNHRIRVATSDGPEQLIILGHGALRLSASIFHAEMDEALKQIQKNLEKNNRPMRAGVMRSAIERALRQKS